MDIAIAGVSGFIGRNLALKAKEEGYKVLGLVRSENSKKRVEKICSEVKLVDFLNPISLEKALKNIDILYHFIGISRESNGETFEKVNYLITKITLEACKNSKVKRFITNSGLGVENYGKKTLVTNRYFLSKRKAEEEILKSNLNYTIFRPSYIIGKDDEITPFLIEKAKEGLIYIIEDGKYRFQPIYIKDASIIYLKSLEVKEAENRIFDLVGDEVISFRDYLNLLIIKLMDKGKILRYPKIVSISFEEAKRKGNPLGLAEEEVDVMVCDEISDSSEIKRVFNIQLTPLKASLDEIVQ